MKKSFIILAILLSNIVLLKAQSIEIPTTQKPVIIKITASWCPNCGSWGWTFFHNLIEDNDTKSVIFAAHSSGNYQNSTSVDFSNNFNAIGQPRFLLNGEDQYVGSNNTSSKRSDFATKVNTESNESLLAQTGIEATYNDNTMTVSYNTKFFSSASGEYYLGLYLIEKEVTGYQAGQGNNAKHKKILREELTGKSFGNLIVSGDISSDNVYEGKVQFDISKYDVKNLEIASIIWKKENDKYEIVNSNIDTEVSYSGTSATKQFNNQEIFSFDIFPTIIQNYATIEINLAKKISNPTLVTYDYNGKLVQTKQLNQLNPGENKILFRLPDNTPKGFYYVKIIAQKGKSFTKKIIVSGN